MATAALELRLERLELRPAGKSVRFESAPYPNGHRPGLFISPYPVDIMCTLRRRDESTYHELTMAVPHIHECVMTAHIY